MSDRDLIFNTKGAQIGYIEADRAFDLTGRERCKYDRETGNLSDLVSEKVVGHRTLDGTFVGLSWIAQELFGKSSGEVHPSRTVASKQRPRYSRHQAMLERPVKQNVEVPKDVGPWAATASPESDKAIEEPRPMANANMALNISEETPEHHPGPIDRAPDEANSIAEDELLGRAIGMIRSALQKGVV